MKYAIKVPFDNEGYIFVTRPTGNMYEIEPVLYDTRDEAVEASKIWGKFALIVEIGDK
jgi:hypothetical protein